MADETTQAATSEEADRQKGATKDDVTFEPGILCAHEVNEAAPPLEFSQSEISSIKALHRKVAMRDMPSRREQIIRCWEERLFDRSFQHLLPRNNGGWELPAIGTGYGSGEEEDRSEWEIDIYSSYRKIICAALTREVPTVRFDPTDPDEDKDITAASKAEKLKVKIERDNKMKMTQEQAARFLWTDGVSVHFTRYVLDAQAFGYEPEPTSDVPEDEETGKDETALAPAEGEQPEDEEKVDGENEVSDSSRNNEANQGGAQAEAEGEEEEPEAEGEEEGEEETRKPRGHELISVGGALEWKLPIKANCLGDCDYARLSFETPTTFAKAAYPDVADDIQPSRGGSDGGSGGDDLERLARVNVMLGVEDNYITEDSAIYDVTMQKYWYRPYALLDIENKEDRQSIMKKCSRGLYCTMAGDVFCEGRNASMDDYLQMTFADAGDGVHRLSLGRPLVAPQKILNTLAELAYETFVHGVPMTYMDDEMFDLEAIRDEENTVGGIRPFEAVGSQVDGVYWFREDPVAFPDKLLEFMQWIMNEVSQLMSGAYPALFGGDMSNEGVGDALMQRDQALGRLGLPWRNIKETTAGVMRQAVQSIAINGQGTIKLGGSESTSINVTDLKGNILCFPDTDENFPETFTQQSNRLDKIITAAATNPFFQQLLDDPSNLQLVHKLSGLKGLSIPMLESFEKQLGEIAILSKTGPAPNPALTQLEGQIKALTAQRAQIAAVAQPAMDQAALTGQQPTPPPELAAADAQIAQLQAQAQQLEQTTPLVSTVPIDVECDDHSVEALTCMRFVNSAKGRAMKNGTKEDMEAFANIRLHGLEHQAADEKKKAAAQAAAQGGGKPPALSANVKDLPAKEAAAVMNKAGIQSDPKDFEAQDAAEAVAKHPTALTT